METFQYRIIHSCYEDYVCRVAVSCKILDTRAAVRPLIILEPVYVTAAQYNSISVSAFRSLPPRLTQFTFIVDWNCTFEYICFYLAFLNLSLNFFNIYNTSIVTIRFNNIELMITGNCSSQHIIFEFSKYVPVSYGWKLHLITQFLLSNRHLRFSRKSDKVWILIRLSTVFKWIIILLFL